jgi:uncharacterized protein YqgQ
MKNVNDSVSKLEEVKKLFDSGLISEKDYQELKETVFSDYITDNKLKVKPELLKITEVKSTVKYYRWFVLYLLLNLGFHFVPSKMMLFPKDHFTFSNTIITDENINSIISRYNNAGVTEKVIMLQDPLINKLFEKQIIENKNYTPIDPKETMSVEEYENYLKQQSK